MGGYDEVFLSALRRGILASWNCGILNLGRSPPLRLLDGGAAGRECFPLPFPFRDACGELSRSSVSNSGGRPLSPISSRSLSESEGSGYIGPSRSRFPPDPDGPGVGLSSHGSSLSSSEEASSVSARSSVSESLSESDSSLESTSEPESDDCSVWLSVFCVLPDPRPSRRACSSSDMYTAAGEVSGLMLAALWIDLVPRAFLPVPLVNTT